VEIEALSSFIKGNGLMEKMPQHGCSDLSSIDGVTT